MRDPDIRLLSPAPNAIVRELHERLADAGQALRDDQLETFVLVIDDDNGEMSAGCKGEIAFRSAHISELWVDDQCRGQGFGRKLLDYAEANAVKQGCTRIHLETRSEAARSLYERLGYRVFGQLEGYDGNVPFYYLEKRIG